MDDYEALGPDRLDDGEMAAFEVGDVRIAVANVDGKLYAFDDICTHEQCNLSDGDLDGTSVSCICHGSQFDVTTGEVLMGPATEPVATYDVRSESGNIEIKL